MIKVEAKVIREEGDDCIKHINVRCPECGSRMMDVLIADGITLLSTRCRKCKHIILVNVKGYNE